MKKMYRFKFYLNASHAVKWENGMGETHPHTWEVLCEIVEPEESLIPFDQIELLVENYLDQFQGKILNNVIPFSAVHPTLENITEVFYHALLILLAEVRCRLYRIEVSESPTRIFCIVAENV